MHDVVVGLEPPRRREVEPVVLLTELATVDAVLRALAAAVGRDFTAYRNHVYRVVNLCMAQRRVDPEQLEKVAVAAAFHDLGIWTDGTFDYLPPSIRLAREWLSQSEGGVGAGDILGPGANPGTRSRQRLEAEICYAAEHGILGRVDLFLRSLPPEAWKYVPA